MHRKRLIVAAALLPVLFLSVMYLPEGYFFILLCAVSFLGMLEFYSMYRVQGAVRYACLLFGVFIIAVSYFSRAHLSETLVFSAMAIMVIRLLTKRDPLSSLHDIAAPVVGLVYIPGFLSSQTQIRNIGPEWIIFLYATVWASDSAAYYIGKGIGKRKLYQEMSPNKTVAGAVGSVAGGAAGALMLKVLIVPQLTLPSAAFIGCLIGIISIAGDLVESMFKRDAGVKDSGVIIPGHGGILDKIDGTLFAGPLLYWVLAFKGLLR
jgi:phosphatidate cytidylyltransferase